jgi:DNA-binding response OmpR family regulator
MTTAPTRRLFLIHWNQSEAEEYARALVDSDWEVDIEAKDGRKAFEAIKANPPAVVIIYLNRLPSHGRETAHALRTIKSLKEIPIIFVGGQGEPLEKTKTIIPDAIYLMDTELHQRLENFRSK